MKQIKDLVGYDEVSSGIIGYLQGIFSFVYLKIMIPITIIAMGYILIIYCINMIRGVDEEISSEVKFRRAVATILPFLGSLFAVLLTDMIDLRFLSDYHFIWFLLVGGAIGFIFLFWISSINRSEELFSTLSCLVASIIFFSVMSAFVVTQSFQVLSFIFGFLFGTCIFIVVHGLSSVKKITPHIDPESALRGPQKWMKNKLSRAGSKKIKEEQGADNATSSDETTGVIITSRHL